MLRSLLLTLIFLGGHGVAFAQQRTPADEPLLDWSPWRQYRQVVKHPASVIKPADLERALENQRRYEWARRYAARVQRSARTMWTRSTMPGWRG